MARRRSSRRPVVPEAAQALERLKSQVMKERGYAVNPENPDNVKFEVARSLGVPLQPGYNGDLRSEEAGKIGGEIGGAMVQEMIRLAKQQLVQQRNRGR